MSLNILIVDDSPVMRKMVLKTLKIAEIPIGEVYEAGNGKEGIDILESHWLDMVFADINMPIMNGEEMIRRMRENPAWRNMPVVVVSTEGSQTRIERIQRRGARFVHKPFSPEVVRDMVQEMTGVSPGKTESDIPDFSDDGYDSSSATQTLADASVKLQDVAVQTMESLAFILQADEFDEPGSKDAPQLLTGVTFEGPQAGKLFLAVPESMLEELGANMLGLDQPPSADQQKDALKELINVVCGNLLPELAGSEAVFNVHAPDRPESGNVPETYLDMAPSADAVVMLEYGPAELRLFMD